MNSIRKLRFIKILAKQYPDKTPILFNFCNFHVKLVHVLLSKILSLYLFYVICIFIQNHIFHPIERHCPQNYTFIEFSVLNNNEIFTWKWENILTSFIPLCAYNELKICDSKVGSNILLNMLNSSNSKCAKIKTLKRFYNGDYYVLYTLNSCQNTRDKLWWKQHFIGNLTWAHSSREHEENIFVFIHILHSLVDRGGRSRCSGEPSESQCCG